MESAKNLVVGSLPKYRAQPDGTLYGVPDDELIWEGAQVVDLDAGLSFEVHVAPRPGGLQVTELTIKLIDPNPKTTRFLPPKMRKKFKGPFPTAITSSLMRRVRVDTLARVVADHIAEQERQRGSTKDGGGKPIYARTATAGDPSVQQVADDFNNSMNREQIAEKYGVDIQKIDRRISKARYDYEPPLITEKPKAGRKRKKST